MNNFLSKNEKLLENPIIFFGPGRSGTTVISEIIFQHPDLAWHSNYQELFPTFAGINYLRYLFDNKLWRKIGMNTQNNSSFTNYMLFRPIERYDFWNAVTGPRIDFARGFLLNEKATDKEREHIRTFFAKMVKYQDRKRLALKITGPARLEYLMSIFPDAQFVYITREPVAIIRSWLRVKWDEQVTNQLWWEGVYTEEELKKANELAGNKYLFAAFQLKKILETTETEIDKLHPDIYRTSYEEFAKDVIAFTNDIMQYLHIQPSVHIDNYIRKIAASSRKINKQPAPAISESTREQILKIING